jgi:hypothetical protein
LNANPAEQARPNQDDELGELWKNPRFSVVPVSSPRGVDSAAGAQGGFDLVEMFRAMFPAACVDGAVGIVGPQSVKR